MRANIRFLARLRFCKSNIFFIIFFLKSSLNLEARQVLKKFFKNKFTFSFL